LVDVVCKNITFLRKKSRYSCKFSFLFNFEKKSTFK